MKVSVTALLAFFVLFLSSCQQEPDVILDDVDPGNPPVDTTPRITNIFKVVEEYHDQPIPDSSVRIVKRVVVNGVKTVVVSEVYSWEPTDTALSVYSYDAQDRLTGIKLGLVGTDLTEAVYKFTWTGDRLTKVAVDTFGSFAESYDLSYVASGTNTIVTAVKIPSEDDISPDATITSKHHVTVGPQFNLVSDRWIHYFHTDASSDPEVTTRDTTDIIYNYAGGDLISAKYYAVAHYLNAPFFPVTGVQNDTLTDTYTRGPGSANIADSLKKIYGSQIYTYLNSGLFDLYYMSPFVDYNERTKTFLNRPFNSHHMSQRTFINGVSYPNSDFTDQFHCKLGNVFDASGRLISMSIYEDYSETELLELIRIYY